MKRVVLSILALALVSLPAPAQERRSVMDRVIALFTRDRAIGFQLVFESLETANDLDVNTTVAEVREVRDASGRHLAVFTSSYQREGLAHRFMFVIRDGELIAVDLQRKSKKDDDGWELVEPTVFSFSPFDDPPPPDFLGVDDVVLIARGHCTPSRGATERKRATIALRSFASAEGRPPAY
jgi:hypothetical protein